MYMKRFPQNRSYFNDSSQINITVFWCGKIRTLRLLFPQNIIKVSFLNCPGYYTHATVHKTCKKKSTGHPAKLQTALYCLIIIYYYFWSVWYFFVKPHSILCYYELSVLNRVMSLSMFSTKSKLTPFAGALSSSLHVELRLFVSFLYFLSAFVDINDI